MLLSDPYGWYTTKAFLLSLGKEIRSCACLIHLCSQDFRHQKHKGNTKYPTYPCLWAGVSRTKSRGQSLKDEAAAPFDLYAAGNGGNFLVDCSWSQ